jgi:lipoate-protein ligase B
MWKFADIAEGHTKEDNMKWVRDHLLVLKEIIPELKRMEIGIDVSHTDMSYDMVLLTEFESLATLGVYKAHPEHVKVSQYVSKVKTARAVIDCEI